MSTREVIERYWTLLVEGNFPAALELFAEEGSYTVSGKTPISKKYAPKAALFTEFMEAVGPLFANGLPRFTTTDIVVEGDRGVIIATGLCKGGYGTYDQTFCFHITVANGEITKLVEYADTLQIETALMGGTLTRKDGSTVG
ncbi:nuclear transport factor 2 family protein [Sphingomonas sp. MG17]|uniref:Nuclear transport factor 2 family protein n=1 Tax=Sphingomonas tagetis TaxID=2949092 RepID=A0A9X2KP46_9SPHN|nr:nuclear transport factor 2 family protein [Sphingomonas tagetis]MCP3730273.1 nuclear transport factor 2 family protein [Sphingomonas tagetis]